ncbi:hypothetical protein ACQKKK_25875 [Peribacillus sp. NPDC006672]|uniref:hypothetical protein n=1 Tax=Peribacillus sp. NPDC006672 TaxID=3390606 RepID=UPI003D0593CB
MQRWFPDISPWIGSLIAGVTIVMMAVNYSLGGTELVGISPGEGESPEKTIPKAINQTVYRIILFFVLSMIIVVSIVS